MALVTLNGIAVLSMELHRPRIGPWRATADLAGTEAPTGTVAIDIGDGALRLTGTAEVDRTGTFVDRVRLRVVGGAGGLDKEIAPRMFRRVPVRIPLTDALTAAGEALSPTADAAFLAAPMTRWVRFRRPARHALEQLAAKVPGTAWRVLADGTVWLGPETWPAWTGEYSLINEDTAERRMLIDTDDPTLVPGQTLGGRRVDEVVHMFEPTSVRAEVWLVA